VLRTSIVTGIVWLIAKYLFVAVLPLLDLKALYGPFYVSVGLLFWAYASGLILFAGAQFSVARWAERPPAPPAVGPPAPPAVGPPAPAAPTSRWSA
jgi:uncharacterized BrkB/YihY/UPF0761 family membrane protein